MFHSARTRLTLWYILIVSVVSISFSVLIYRDISWELGRGFQIAEQRLLGNPYARSVTNLVLLHEQLQEARRTLLMRLVIVNGFIITMSGVASYFLAGKTLKPLEEAIEEQKRFVSDASHELRTPLTSLRSEIEVALRDKSVSHKEAKELLTSNLEEVEKMQKLINYLLNLSRYEKSQVSLVHEQTNLSRLVSGVVDKFAKQAAKKGITLTIEAKSFNLKLHKTSIEELVSILVDNAIKFTPPGGLIVVSVEKTKRKAIIRVKDTGIGIAPEDLPHIFDRFYRADTARSKTQRDGYGLGLAIAKSIVDAHKGEIKVKSSSKRGTLFTVTL